MDINETVKAGKKLVEFEGKQSLSYVGMNLEDRWDRFMQSFIYNLKQREESQRVLDFFKNKIKNPPTPKADTSQSIVTIPEMAERAKQGSKVAQNFFVAMSMMEQANAYLQINNLC